jgi:hypothetical protein
MIRSDEWNEPQPQISLQDGPYRVAFSPDPENGDHRYLVVRSIMRIQVEADCKTREAAERVAAELNAGVSRE